MTGLKLMDASNPSSCHSYQKPWTIKPSYLRNLISVQPRLVTLSRPSAPFSLKVTGRIILFLESTARLIPLATVWNICTKFDRNMQNVISNKAVCKTTGSAIAEKPRVRLYHLKSCQLMHNCTKNCTLKDLHGHSRSSELPLFYW